MARRRGAGPTPRRSRRDSLILSPRWRNQGPMPRRRLASALVAAALFVFAGCGPERRAPPASRRAGAPDPPPPRRIPRFRRAGHARAICCRTGRCSGTTPSTPARARGPPGGRGAPVGLRDGGAGLVFPAVGLDGTVYVGSLDALYAISPRGKLQWTSRRWATLSPPAVAGDGTVYFGLRRRAPLRGAGGRLKWAVPLQNCAFSSPALGQRRHRLRRLQRLAATAISPAGEIAWRFAGQGPHLGDAGASCATATCCSARTTPGSTRWAPAARARACSRRAARCARHRPWAGRHRLLRLRRRALYALDAAGQTRWVFSPAPPSSPPRPSPPTAPSWWARPTTTSTPSAPTAASGGRCRPARPWPRRRPIAADGTVFVGCDDGTVWSIGADGRRRWTYKTGGTVFSSPAIAPDGTVYVGSADGRLYAFR